MHLSKMHVKLLMRDISNILVYIYTLVGIYVCTVASGTVCTRVPIYTYSLECMGVHYTC